MKHLIICREYPPAPGGGIGTYVRHMARLLADSGETVHVIGQQWKDAEHAVEEHCQGRLIVHRVPYEAWPRFVEPKPHAALATTPERGLFASGFAPQCFSWQASLLAERLVVDEGIELIEAQEYEAPLYYFQLRRALGYGPKRQPVCVVHLHSPTELIARYNDWDIGTLPLLTAKRLEDYSITAADALLCPSRYLAHQVETAYGLAAHSIQTIPYPLGVLPEVSRQEAIWEQGSVCYVGRLERRKGILEWLDAAIAVAQEDPAVRFEFLGANILEANRLVAEEFLERQIPRALKPRFLFRGEQKRDAVVRFLRTARIAVVPSRWENFPNTCIEAMAAGLPVIASPAGGMAEMVADDRTGWIAPQATGAGLATALRRALATPPERLSAMGREAAMSIRRMCDNQHIVEQQLAFRERLVHGGATRSLHLPACLRRTERVPTLPHPGTTRSLPAAMGLAMIVTCQQAPHLLTHCVQSIAQQTRAAATVVVVVEPACANPPWQMLEAVEQHGWQVIHRRPEEPRSALQLGLAAVRGAGKQPLGVAFLDTADCLEPSFIATCERILQHCPDVGLVSGWVQQPQGAWMKPCPTFPYQWLWNDSVPCSVMRTAALRETVLWQEAPALETHVWDVVNAMLAHGWLAVTAPELLAVQVSSYTQQQRWPGLHMPSKLRQELVVHFPETMSRDAKDLLLLAHFDTALAGGKRVQASMPMTMARLVFRHPRAAYRLLRTVTNKMLLHLPVWVLNILP